MFLIFKITFLIIEKDENYQYYNLNHQLNPNTPIVNNTSSVNVNSVHQENIPHMLIVGNNQSNSQKFVNTVNTYSYDQPTSNNMSIVGTHNNGHLSSSSSSSASPSSQIIGHGNGSYANLLKATTNELTAASTSTLASTSATSSIVASKSTPTTPTTPIAIITFPQQLQLHGPTGIASSQLQTQSQLQSSATSKIM
jgi:hypothetical protein